MDYQSALEQTKSIADIFALAKKLVGQTLGLEQPGILVGLADLGQMPNGFIGAFYHPASNTILINKRPMASILHSNPSIYRAYVFHVILHEYIHAVGAYDEATARKLAYQISALHFGDTHPAVEMAGNIEKFMPDLMYAPSNFPVSDEPIEFIKGIDIGDTRYIN